MTKTTHPLRPLSDSRFRYVNSARTDIRETWRRALRRDRLLQRIRGAK